VRSLLTFLSFSALLFAVACGGGSSGNSSSAGGNTVVTSASNVQPIAVNAGPAYDGVNPNTAYANGAFTSVTVCVPGSSTCQTIDGVLVDTGSIGLRLLASAVTVPLPQSTMNGSPMSECNQFVDGYTYGSVRLADMKIAGEQASSMPIQLVGDPSFSSVPISCTNTGLVAENDLQSLGANGVLGVGPFLQDCGTGCAVSLTSTPDFYYVCPSSGCQQTLVSLAQELPNPVSLFAQDNNGVVIELPSVPSAGVASVSGSLVFGIGTQSNNGLSGATVLLTDANASFTTIYSNVGYSGSFIDSGSNALYFLDAGTTGIAVCSSNSGFYCPTATRDLSATDQGADGTTKGINFTLANAETLFNANPNFTAFSNLAGPNPGAFDWGLPFFFGRNVFTAIEQQSTPGGMGPYFAYK
jgi:hypothetical protein